MELFIAGSPRHGFFQCLHFFPAAEHLRKSRTQHILHGIARRKMGNLGNQTQPLVRVDVYLSPIEIHLSGENLEQCGFSASVPSQNRHPFSFLNLKAEILQKVFANDEKFR